MPIVAASGKSRRKIRFPQNTRLATSSEATATEEHRGEASTRRIKNTPTPEPTTTTTTMSTSPSIPSLFTTIPTIQDSLQTKTSADQDETVTKCLPFLTGRDGTLRSNLNEFGLSHLMKDKHIEYLYDSLEDYPEGFVAMDSSRPWMSYWALAGLTLLGEDVSKYRERVVATFTAAQNPTGGFGGGHGQMSHLASTFPAVLSLALVGGEEAYKVVDRRAMWSWLGQLKQPDGGFQLVIDGEEDVRGAYCAMVTISLLNLPLELPPEAEARKYGLRTFLDGLPEYLSRCEFEKHATTTNADEVAGQTYEGGLSGKPGAAEAHGAYAFCVLACLCIMGQPKDMITRYMDIPLLISWLSARQYAPEGGFSGRTNKLVDGCYSHWVGDCWPLVQSALNGPYRDGDAVPEMPQYLFSREGLARYIMNCCQNKNGGLRDKPGKHPDSYHSCYTLTGLSTIQYYHYQTEQEPTSSRLGGIFASSFSWKSIPANITADENEANSRDIIDNCDRLVAFHPIYTIPHKNAEALRRWCEERPI
ncbi:Protein farnesyltransferase subunit beta [Talaromyces pinophilus]|nr:Protein farnesyltransferase subunit beta [Talaromyces pinophilus]